MVRRWLAAKSKDAAVYLVDSWADDELLITARRSSEVSPRYPVHGLSVDVME